MTDGLYLVRIGIMLLGIAAWWFLAFLAVQRGLVEHPKHAAFGTPVAVTGMTCLVILWLLDFVAGFSGLSLWFSVISVGHFLLVIVPLGLWLLRRRKRNGWDVGQPGSA